MIPEYAHDEAAQIAEDRQRLSKACVDIPRMEDQLDLLIRSLDGARRLRDVLTESLPLRMRALELLCADKGWDLPTVPPAAKPTPIADGITRETTHTLAFEQLIPCRHCGAPVHELHDHVTGVPFWTHVHQDFVACDLVVQGSGDTHAEPAQSAATTQTDDPLRFQRLDQGEVREAVTCICGTPGIGQYEGPQRDCPVHGEQQDGGTES